MDERDLLTLEKRPPMFKFALESGAVITGILIVLTMLGYLLNLHAEQWLAYLSIGIMIIALYVAGTKYRDSAGRSPLKYGEALKFLILTLVITTVIGSVFNYIYFIWIAPETIDMALEKAYEDMLDRGMSQDQVDQQMKFVLPWMNPAMFTVVGALMTLFWGAIASLIMAAMLKRESTSI